MKRTKRTFGQWLVILAGAALVVAPIAWFLLVKVPDPYGMALLIGISIILSYLVESSGSGERNPRVGDDSLLEMVGCRGTAEDDFFANVGRFEGRVSVGGETWAAFSREMLSKGDAIRIVARSGLSVEVAKDSGVRDA